MGNVITPLAAAGRGRPAEDAASSLIVSPSSFKYGKERQRENGTTERRTDGGGAAGS